MMIHRPLMDRWRDTFVTQARLHDVPGPRIGEALAEVDTHCADSGQNPEEAFGDPVEYARTYAHSQPGPGSAGGLRRPWAAALMALGTLAGVFCLLEGVDAVTHAAPAVLTVGEVTSVVTGTVAVTIIVAAVLRPGRRHTSGQLALVVFIGLALGMYAQILWKHPVLNADGWILLTGGLLMLALAWWPRAANRLILDRILDPRTGKEPFRRPRLVIAATVLSLPVTLLCVVLLTALLPNSVR